LKYTITFNRESNSMEWLWYIIVFLFSVNLFGRASYLLLALLLIGLIIIEIKKSKFKITSDFIYILIFSVIYYLILINYRSDYGAGAMLQYLIGPVAMFFIGYFVVLKESKFITKTIFMIILGNFVHGFLNMIGYFTNSSNSVLRVVPDVWTGLKMAATIQGTHFTLISSTLFLIFLMYKKSRFKIIPTIVLFGIIFSIYSSLVLGNRTLLVIVLMIFCINILVYTMLNKTSRSLQLILSIFLLISILVYLYSINILGVKEFIEGSNFYNRMEQSTLTDDPRINIYFQVANQMFLYPFGGYKMDLSLYYAHNLWLDVLYATGLIPFFFLLLFTFRSIVNLTYIVKNKKIDITFKLLILSVSAGYVLNFMVEPILEGVPFMFLSFCLISGMLRKYKDILQSETISNYKKIKGCNA
jgi:hypothetical protein